MKSNKSDPSKRSGPRTLETTAERRRLGRIVHDDRGNASVEWLDLTGSFKRDPLRIVDTPLSIQQENDRFNPYDHKPVDRTEPRSPKRDLRKLSAWIKQMRSLEDKKSRGKE